MANAEHLAILKQGVEAWNEWRIKKPDALINLDGADLHAMCLSGANLNGTNLSEVDLRWAILREADLRGADLTGAQLSGADLTGAILVDATLTAGNLGDTHLSKADLSGADLREANLRADFSLAQLGGANLSKADLSGANLTDAALIDADLHETILSGANLSGADLSRANLSGAYFTGANLDGANLCNASLMGTNLSGARLDRANLSDANLSNSNFTGVHLYATIFSDVNLGQVTGIENAIHSGPSTIGIDTIYKSKGNIPEIFLRGCGVPENFITYMHSLTGKAFDFYSCFISHSAQDKRFCERLYADLQAKHVRTWYFPEDAKWGATVWAEIDRSIKVYDKLVVVCSENSLQSGPVNREIERTLVREDKEGKGILFPIRIDDYIFTTWEHERKADVLRKVVGDFSGWDKDAAKYDKAFDKLLKGLQAEDKK